MGRLGPALVSALAACANAAAPADPDATGPAPPDAPPLPLARQCPPGQLAVDVPAEGPLACSSLDELAAPLVDDHCSVYLGWRDDCDGCTSPPAKWGRAGATCMVGAGAASTCRAHTLGSESVELLGLNLDGDVDGNDKLYGGLHCAAVAPSTAVSPCPAGELVAGTNGSGYTCAPVAAAVVAFVRDHCSIYLGWQDNCDGCVDPPAKWGRAGDGRCANGAGASNTCSVATLGGESLDLFGLNPDGDVDNNDKLHVGLHCTAPAAASGPADATCPAGQFVSGILEDGRLQCESPATAIAQAFAQRCTLVFGWRDNCDGCANPPAKWGRVRVGGCMLGAGVNDTCGRFSLTGDTIDLLGINTDGNVDGNDTLYVGFTCR